MEEGDGPLAGGFDWSLPRGITGAAALNTVTAISADSQSTRRKGVLSTEEISRIRDGLRASRGDVELEDAVFEIIAGTHWEPALKDGNIDRAESIWDETFKIVHAWEQGPAGHVIHKGTGYYFWGVNCIVKGDLEKGFLLMHQALEEDKRTHGTPTPSTPARHFVTLNHGEVKQYFRGEVQAIARFVDGLLHAYRLAAPGALTLADFSRKFLEDPTLNEEVFSFVYEVFHLHKLLEHTDQALLQNDFSSLLLTKPLLNLCIITDSLIKPKNPAGKYFSDHLVHLAEKARLNLTEPRIKQELGKRFTKDFQGTVSDLLNGKLVFSDKYTPRGIEVDISLAHGFRNFGAHRLENQAVIFENSATLSQRIMNVLFYAVEILL